MSPRLLLCVFLVFVFAGCEERDLRTPAIRVVVHGDINYWKFADHWAFMTDDDGTVFDAQPLSNNATTQLRAVANAAKLHLTICTIFKDVSNSYYFYTYTDLTRHQDFHLHQFPAPIERVANGTSSISINNYSEPSAPNGSVVFSALDGINSITNISNVNNIYSATVSLYSFPQNLVLSAYRNGIPVYKMIKDVQANSTLTLDFNDFTPAENTLELSYPASAGVTVLAYPDDQSRSSYQLAGSHEFSLTNSDRSQFSIGYPKIFPKYFSRIRMLQDGNVIELQKRGGPVSTFQMPELDYTITDPSIQNFQIEVSSNATHAAGIWTNSKNTQWQVFSAPGKGSVVKSIPTELIRKYNDIAKINELKISGINLFQHSAGSYLGWLQLEFGEEAELNYEKYTKEIQLN